MNKGKELLIDIVLSYQDKLSMMDDNSILISDIDIIDLYKRIKSDKFYLGNVSNELIDEIISINKYKSHFIFIKKLYQLRDLYLDKINGNEIKDKDDSTKILSTFLELLDNIIEKDEGYIQKEQTIIRLNNLISAIKYNEIINDQELIEVIVKEYDELKFDTNMLDIMGYVSRHNINILSSKTLEDTINISGELKLSELDEDVKDVLNKVEINYNELSIDYKLLIKNTPKEHIINIYELIKHNKVEDYGILHLIDRKSDESKLLILLLSNINIIKEIVDLFRDNNNDIDIKSLKIVINTLLPVFINKDNSFYNPLYNNFISNIKLFNSLNINVSGLLKKCPIIFIVEPDKLNNLLNILNNKYKVDKKKVINKLYKTMSLDIDLVLTNIDILKKYLDVEKYLKGDNYNLLKVIDLDKKINIIKNKYDMTKVEEINNNLVKEIYDNRNLYVWGDKDA